MKTFKDSKDRTWDLAVNCDTIETVKAARGVNVLDLLDPESDLTREVAAFPPAIAALLFAAVADQAKTKEVDDREFRRSMGGDALADATDALLEELISFCPRHRRQVAAAVLEKNREVQAAASELAMTKLADPSLKAQLMEALEANLRKEMEAAVENLTGSTEQGAGSRKLRAPSSPPPASATALSSAAGTRPACSASPDLDHTPGGS